MANDGSVKWECEYCTYKNFDAAKKCTICHANRPPIFITEKNQDPDIYQVASLIQPVAEASVLPQHGDPMKWSCPKCTYYNWTRSRKCIVCMTPRRDLVGHDNMPEAEITEMMQPLTINVTSNSEICHPSSSYRLRSPSLSPNAESNNDKNRALVATIKSITNKWICRVCTYENWPKAVKCIICGSSVKEGARSTCSPCVSPGCSVGKTSDSKATSPPSSPRGAAAASLAVSTQPRKSELQGQNPRRDVSSIYKYNDKLSEIDWLWLKACSGILEGDRLSVDAYLASGGDVARQLTSDEALLLGPPATQQKGHTLLHLALQYQREDILALLLTASVTSKTRKRLPPHVCPDLANEILRTVACSLRQRKGDFPCSFLTDRFTFALHADIEDLLPTVRKQLLNDILDQDVQKELEMEESIINWSVELCGTYQSRLYALWNRSAGDCLLDSVLQSTWGVFDKDNTLRIALSDSLTEGDVTFYPRWKEYESRQAQFYDFTLDANQWQQDWSYIQSLARQPGSALEQTHIFVLAHILRRPIIVYGVKYVKSFRGETIDLAKFQGVYLPLLWESSFCWKDPIALGYTRGHFSALVPMETDPYRNEGAGAMIDSHEEKVVYLPLVEKDGLLLPLHFLSQAQMKREKAILQEWLVCREVAGIFCAEQHLGRPPPLVKQMVEEWFDRYRNLSEAMSKAGVGKKSRNRGRHRVLSDYETDDE